jgi:hypothetical protein
MHVPTTTLEVARTMTALGMLLEASALLEGLEKEPEIADEPDVFVNARQAAKELGRELEQRIPRLHFNDAAGAARVTLDGKALDAGALSDSVRVNPGRHVALAEQGGVKRKRQLDVAEGSTLEVSFGFTAAAASEAPRAGEPTSARKSSRTRPSTIAIYGLSGLAVAGVGTGIGVGLWANQRKAQLESSCAPHCSERDVTQLRSGYVAANIAAGVGLASAVAAVTIYFARPRESEGQNRHASASSLAIAASAGGEPGLSVAGSF